MQSIRRLFATRPILSNCIVYGTLYAGAELSQQTLLRKILAEKPEPLDLNVVARYGALGSTVFPSFLFYWYKWLDGRFVGTAMKTVVSKVFIDQAISAPIILVLFYTGMSLMEGKEDLFAECKEKIVPTFTKSCMFWMPAQAVNFLLVPQTMRVVYIAACSFVWVNILCVVKRSDSTAAEDRGSS